MGVWGKLFGLPAQTTVLEGRMVQGDELVAVVGESNYQDALRAICGSDRGQVVKHDCCASLIPEPDNQFDPNAVYVEIDGQKVGYLGRQDAIDYKAAVDAFRHAGRAIMCEARISGRGRDGETSMVGVWLQLPFPDEGDLAV